MTANKLYAALFEFNPHMHAEEIIEFETHINKCKMRDKVMIATPEHVMEYTRYPFPFISAEDAKKIADAHYEDFVDSW